MDNVKLGIMAEQGSVWFSPTLPLKTTLQFLHQISNFQNVSIGFFSKVHAGEILSEMEKIVPSDAFCMSAITLCDLYPRDEWNFVFGLASHVKQVGVYSLARYSPGFYKEGGQAGNLQSLNKYVFQGRVT